MLTLRWDDGSVTSVDRRRTVGSDAVCDTTLDGLEPAHLLVEAVGRWALVEDVSGPACDVPVLVDGLPLDGRAALAAGATITVGPRSATVEVIAGEVAAAGLLTDRQVDVLACIGDGDTLEEAAVRLSLSPHTVRSHLQGAYRRLDVSSKADALGVLFHRGVFPDRRSGEAHPDGLYAGLLAQRRPDEDDDTIIIPADFAAWESRID